VRADALRARLKGQLTMDDLIATADVNAYPIRLAAVDIGSNAIRMLIGEFSDPVSVKPLDQQRLPLRLGHDVFLTGQLTSAAMKAAIEGLQSFSRRMRELGVTTHRAVATSAVRDSGNGAALVTRAREEAGITINVITAAEEARLVHLAVRHQLELGREKWLIADLGGGSVEVSVVDHNAIYRTESYEMGSVRLLEELGAAGEDPRGFRHRLEEYTSTLRSSRILHTNVAGFIATGGNIEALARLANPGPDKDGVATLRTNDLRTIIERLAGLSYAERVEQLNLRADRADVILPAAMVYERLTGIAGVDTILVPGVGVKEGVLWDLIARDRIVT
jgi:exopolyphosphatase / guanosine-5'-triphosphate,3'-diphosphate pyrophosphatase